MASRSSSSSNLCDKTVKLEEARQRRLANKSVRTTLACTRCRQRRIKCSGIPAPCDVCRKDDEFCHFHPRMDSRRKDGLSSNDIAIRRKSILHGLLLAIRFNSDQEIQDLVQLLRSPYASPLDMAGSLHHQLCIALSKSRDGAPQPTQDDLLSLVLLDTLSHHKQLMKHLSDTGAQQESDDAFVTESFESASAHTTFVSPIDSSGYSPFLPQDVLYDTAFTSDDEDCLPLDDANFFRQSLSLPSGQVEASYPYSVSPFWNKSRANSDISALPTLSSTDTSVSGLNRTMTHGFDLPFSPPYTDFSRLCLSLRDSGRQLLAQGILLSDLVGDRRLNCELLFRDRTDHDRLNISNWSCEIVRRLPQLPPSTRIALALCFARMMPYLLLPCQRTWEALPDILRPTSQQFNNLHDITVAFFPLPAIRNLLANKHVDWLNFASQYRLTLDWHGVWGDIDGTVLTTAGHWHHQSQPLRQRRNVNLALQIQPEMSDRPTSFSEMKAIAMDVASGQLHVSDEFERQCWVLDNWYFDEGILGVWPQLKDHSHHLRRDPAYATVRR